MKNIKEILREREFISVGTCDLTGRPNAAPKLLLKVEGNFIYLADYVSGATFINIKMNPRISMSFMDLHNLIGYQLNGAVEIIEEGEFYNRMLEELSKREIELSVKRIIEGVDTGKKHKTFEVSGQQQAAILKVKVEELVEITPSGKLIREKLT